MVSIFVNAIFISLVMMAVYFRVCRFPLIANIYIDNSADGDHYAQGKVVAELGQYIENILGIALMMSNQISFSASLSAILQIPL